MRKRWSIPATPEAVPMLRREVAAFASTAGVPDPPLADVRLAVSEAVSNVVLHGYREVDEPGPVEVTAEFQADEFCMLIADEGVGFAPRADSPGLGLGFPLLATVSDRLEVRHRDPQGTEICLCFALT